MVDTRNGETDKEVKIYSTDEGHPVDPARGQTHGPAEAKQTQSGGDPVSGETTLARCRACLARHLWTSLALATLVGGALGALASTRARRRR